MNEHWNFKANVMNLLHSLYRQEHEKANIYKSLCVEKELGSWKYLGEKFHMQGRHPKWLNIIYFFFMLKCTEFFWKYLLERGKKSDITYKERKGDRLAQERMTQRNTKASGHPFPSAHKSPGTKYKEATKQEKQI